MEFIDLKAQYRQYQEEIDHKVLEVIGKTHFILGGEVRIFEERLARYVGRKYAVSCSDGTSALQLAYMVYGIGPGDAVFCPDMTFIATVEPACLMGAVPVFCDIDRESYNIAPESLERQVERVEKEGKLRPRAVVAVDFLGNPADYGRLRQAAERHGLLLIEDGAQGMGAELDGGKCCSFGDIAATSFFPTKPLGCYGDGGAVFTDDEVVYQKLLSLRVHGKGKTKYDNVRIGINSRLDELQAGVLNVKLGHLDEEIAMRQEVARRYDEALGDLAAVPQVREGAVSAYAQYILVLESQKVRDSLMGHLKEQGVPTIQYYPNPMHRLPVFGGVENYGEEFLNATAYADRSLGLPFSPYISREDQEKVIRGVRIFFERETRGKTVAL